DRDQTKCRQCLPHVFSPRPLLTTIGATRHGRRSRPNFFVSLIVAPTPAPTPPALARARTHPDRRAHRSQDQAMCLDFAPKHRAPGCARSHREREASPRAKAPALLSGIARTVARWEQTILRYSSARNAAREEEVPLGPTLRLALRPPEPTDLIPP